MNCKMCGKYERDRKWSENNVIYDDRWFYVEKNGKLKINFVM